jgi:hypothetical protein
MSQARKTITMTILGAPVPAPGFHDTGFDRIPVFGAQVQSARDGDWGMAFDESPADGVSVGVAHAVVYDGFSDVPLDDLEVTGSLSFDPNRDTRITLSGLVQQGTLDVEAD